MTQGRGRPQLYCGQPDCNRERNADRQRSRRTKHHPSPVAETTPARPSHYQVPTLALDSLDEVEVAVGDLLDNPLGPKAPEMKASLKFARSAIALTLTASGYR